MLEAKDDEEKESELDGEVEERCMRHTRKTLEPQSDVQGIKR